MSGIQAEKRIRFGPFELDGGSCELRKNSIRLKITGQPLQILGMLLERPGTMVTREELREHLWTADTFVDFEHSLNTAIKRLRRALEDDPEHPRYVETVPRRGYRFIGVIEPEPAEHQDTLGPGIPAANSAELSPVSHHFADRTISAAGDPFTSALETRSAPYHFRCCAPLCECQRG